MLNPIYRLLTWLVLLLGLAGSGAVSYWVKLDIDAREYQQFVYYCEEIKLKIIARLKAHEQTLLSGAAVFDASETVNRYEWYAYTQRLRFNEHFNGIQGLGFAKWIPATQLSAHEAAIRAEGFPDYTVRPKGEREAYSAIVFIEPFTGRNLRAFGYDMYSEPVRRAAMARARDENSVTLSERVTLVQETDNKPQAGTLMYVPVYEKNKPLDTVEQRRAALFGWVYSPFRMTDLLNNIVSSTQETDATHIHLRVYEGRDTQAEHLLYDNNPNYSYPDSSNQRLSLETNNDFNDTLWTLQFEKVIEANSLLAYLNVWITLITGILISTLLFLLSYSHLNTQIKAANIAAKLTRELQESENRFRVLADNAPVLIWLSGLDKRCYHFNKVWLNFTGRTLAQEQGNGWAEGVHPDDFQHCLAIYVRSFDAHTAFKMEYRLRRYDGEYRWLLDNGIPRFADDGSFLGYIGSCIDITESKQTETKIEKSLSLLSATLEASSDAILVVDLNNNWVLYNQKFIDLWHITDEIIESKEDSIALHYVLNQLDDAAGFLNKVQTLYHTPEASSFDIINFKNGEIIERYSVPQRINDKVVGRVWGFRDVTERTQAERALQRESEKNLALLRNASDGIHILDTEGNVIEASDSFCVMLGYQRDEMIGMNVTQWAAKPPADCIESVKRQFAKQGRSEFETRHRRKDGTIIDVEISGFPLVLDGKPALFNSSRDISKRKRVENALQESQTLLQTAQRAARLGHYVLDLRVCTAIAWTSDTLFDEIFGIDENFIHDLANLPQIIHPEDLAPVMDVFLHAFHRHKKQPSQDLIDPIEYRIIRPSDGVERWIEMWGYNSYDDNGNPIWQVGMVQDITDRKLTELAKRASEEQLRAFYELDLVGLTITSPKKGWIRVNDCLCKMLEYPEASLRQMNWSDLTYPDDLAADVEQFEKILTNEINGYALEKRFVSRTGKIIPTRLVVRCVRKDNGDVDYITAMVEDISEYKKAEVALRIAATVFESQEGMMITDTHHVILNVNRAFTQITGYSTDEVIGQTPRILHSGRHEKAFYTALWQSIQNTGVWQGEIWNRRKNGDCYPEWLTITAVKGDNDRVSNYVSTLVDITERKATEEYIHRLAFYDSLTQLPNRRLLQERLKHGIELHHRTGSRMAVLMMDLDKFKAVNDTLGHAAGDELLQQVAERVRCRLREVDMVARLGGDEFVILLEDVSQYEHVGYVAKSIIDTLSQPFTLSQNHEVFIGASIGIALHPQHGDSIETLMDNADAALYHAKEQGRGCFIYFSEALTQKAYERVALEAQLRTAVEQQQLRLYFQPQIDMNSGRLIGAEVLGCWYDALKASYLPLKDVMTIVEETRLIVIIGEWVLRETCQLGRQWLAQGLAAVTLAVNISSYQLRRCDIKTLVMQILHDTGFPADNLALEITETGLMDNQQQALSVLNSLHEQGIHLAIDDFGTGYSSLAHLKHFPIDSLKIDKTFIDDIPFSQDDCVITATIIDMAHHLGFKVLAEGVETPEQLTFLREHGCDSYQGSLYSVALSADDFRMLLNSQTPPM